MTHTLTIQRLMPSVVLTSLLLLEKYVLANIHDSESDPNGCDRSLLGLLFSR